MSRHLLSSPRGAIVALDLYQSPGAELWVGCLDALGAEHGPRAAYASRAELDEALALAGASIGSALPEQSADRPAWWPSPARPGQPVTDRDGYVRDGCDWLPHWGHNKRADAY